MMANDTKADEQTAQEKPAQPAPPASPALDLTRFHPDGTPRTGIYAPRPAAKAGIDLTKFHPNGESREGIYALDVKPQSPVEPGGLTADHPSRRKMFKPDPIAPEAPAAPESDASKKKPAAK